MALLRPFTLIAATFFLLTACSHSPVVQLYEGAKRPDDQVLTVRIPNDLKILTLNGQEVEGVNTFFTTEHQDLKLSPGRYRILAYYKRLWELDSDRHTVIKSDPAEFTIDGKAGESYHLGFERPKNASQARKLETNFSGWVENLDSGEKSPSQSSDLVLNRGVLSPFKSSKAKVKSAATVEPESTVTTPPSTTEETAPSPQKSSNNADPNGYLETLKAQWNQATQEERRQFLQWLSQ